MENFVYCIRTENGYLDAIEFDIYEVDDGLPYLLYVEKISSARLFNLKELRDYLKWYKREFRQFFPDGVRIVALIPETRTPVYGITIHWPKGDK